MNYGLSTSHICVLTVTDQNSSGTRFTLSRDELLTLPEFVLLSLFPNGLLPDGHMNSYHDGDVYPVDVSQPAITQASRSSVSIREIESIMSNYDVFLSDIIYHSQYDPTSLQYMLEFFRHVAQTIPQSVEDESLDQSSQDPSAPSRISAPLTSARTLYKTINDNFNSIVFARRYLERLGVERYLAGVSALVPLNHRWLRHLH